MAVRAERELLGVYMDWLVADKARVGYRMLRPMVTRGINTAAGLERALTTGFEMDCSESLVLLCHLAGLKDPSGNGYDGDGNTSQILAHLTGHYTDPAKASQGAICIFNSDRPLTEQHGTMVRHPARDPVLFTHGSAADPSLLRLSQIQPGFKGKTVFCPISSL